MAVKENKKRVMVSLSNDVFLELEKMSQKTGLSKSALITMWINEKKKA
ncbi:transcriptional regulator [Macrococcoides caseolyticum]|nr:transcriptional regulator [Macrococcus caseolyticus]MCE4958073.1 transcriptional regulator [Macrococcus caseolyticus]